MKFRFSTFPLLVMLLSQVSWGEDPLVELAQWLKKPVNTRPDIGKESFAGEGLSKVQAARATALLLQDFQDRIRSGRKKEWEDKVIVLGKLSMKFDYKIFGKKPRSGRSLFISMHGGGGAPAGVNDQQWENQKRLYEPKEGVYLAPRAPTNTWNLWHQGHIDEFFERMIENAIVFEQVDPNKVYIMGYSAGGDGVYQLAPRMADSLAAAAMMAGHPNNASPLGLRNIGFTLHMGGKDSAYNRNGVARQWKTMLADLQKKDPQGYKHEVVIREQYGHWMNREDRVAVPWMSKFTRNPNPQKVVWRQSGTTHDRFYWLAVDPANRKNGSLIVATRAGQKFTIEKMDNVERCVLRINDQMSNLDQPVLITLPDGTKQETRASRTIDLIYRCLSERVDPAAIYSAEVVVKFKP